MRTFSTLVLHERHGQPAIGYRAETIDQIARGDMAEGTHGAWELRCWTLASQSPGYGVTADELVALVGSIFRMINYCLGGNGPSDTTQRFHCSQNGAVVDLSGSQPLPEHLTVWGNKTTLNDVFLQARNIGTEQLQAIGHVLQQEIEAMVKAKDATLGQPHPSGEA